ncbi:hypothetical protein SeLEV6574_g07855 [Synchytrium endobioticum]|uniref:Vps53 N-terminal domain-containing protein n=1 Tax=Synchytrium endobioticum TaxID=286115 RepID=A0A507C8B3_9FUNG|nr:hypothetical protein SeLEV6574_g07855 [Synchytrium endobioticum]
MQVVLERNIVSLCIQLGIAKHAPTTQASWYTDLLLKDYRNIFRNSTDVGGLDNVSRRYAWLKRILKTYDDEHSQIFPMSWNVAEALCDKFCLETKKDLESVLIKLGATVDSKIMLQALQQTIDFESKLGMRFGSRCKSPELATASPTDPQADDDTTPLCPRIAKARCSPSVYGLCLILCIVVLWTSSSFATRHIYDSGFSKPYFLTFANTASFALYLLPALYCSRPHRYKRLSDDENAPDTDDAHNGPCRVPLPLVAVHVVDEPLPPLGVNRTALASLLFALLWFCANYSQAASIKFTPVGTSTVCSSTSGLFTYVIGLALRVPGERFSALRSIGVLGSLVGVALVSMADTPLGSAPQWDEVVGDGLALVGALSYAVYSILLKRLGSRYFVNPFWFFGFVGAFSIVLYVPGFVVLDGTGFEVFELPSARVLGIVVLNAFLGTFLSDFIWMQAVIATSATQVTVGLTLTIPLASVGDVIVQGRALPWMYIIGAILCVSGFVAVAQE